MNCDCDAALRGGYCPQRILTLRSAGELLDVNSSLLHRSESIFVSTGEGGLLMGPVQVSQA